MAQTHHYLFDTATGFTDSTGSTDYVAATGTISLAGKINQCLTWSYPGGAANFGPGIFGTSPFSVAFWSKMVSSPSVGTYFSNEFGWQVQLSTFATGLDTVSVSYFGTQMVTVTIPAGTLVNWTHIVVTSNGANSWGIYINGSINGPFPSMSSIMNHSSSSSIGYNQFGSSGTHFVDDVRFYDNIIDSTEVAFIYNGGAGTQAVSGGGGGAASGTLPVVTMSGPAGTASSGSAGSASGALSTVTMSGPAGTASSGSSGAASGSLATVTISAMSGIAEPGFNASGALSTISITPFEATASVTTSIQLSYCACDAEIGWRQSLPITGFASAVQGDDTISARITPIVSGIEANIVFFEQRTLTALATHTYDLQALTDFLGQAFSLTKVYGISVKMTSGSVTFSPGASNPLQWFFKSNTANVTITSGNSFMFAQKSAAIVSSSAKTILVSNPSSLSACVYKIAILGGR